MAQLGGFCWDSRASVSQAVSFLSLILPNPGTLPPLEFYYHKDEQATPCTNTYHAPRTHRLVQMLVFTLLHLPRSTLVPTHGLATGASHCDWSKDRYLIHVGPTKIKPENFVQWLVDKPFSPDRHCEVCWCELSSCRPLHSHEQSQPRLRLYQAPLSDPKLRSITWNFTHVNPIPYKFLNGFRLS